jgi:hypothetical protein
MRLQISDPRLGPDLVRALNETDCLAARTREDVIDVFVPWVAGADDVQGAATELQFFADAWAAAHPGCRVRVVV